MRKINMDGFIFGYFLVELIRIFDGTILDARRTTRTLVLDDVSRFLGQGDVEITCPAFYAVNFGKCQYFNVWMPADLDQFG